MTSRRQALLLLTAATLRGQSPGVRITYLANEGVLLEGSGARVVIDALFRDSLESYARHSPAVQEQLETGRPPFQGIDLALATHFHLDHWDAGSISRFLRSNPKARFISTPPATAMMPYALRPQVQAVWPEPGRRDRIEAASITVEAFRLVHGQTQNLGYRLNLGGRTLVHLGDGDAEETNFQTLLDAGPVDVALVPWWWLTGRAGSAFLRDRWKPKHVVAFHIGAGDLGSVPAMRNAWPTAWLCTMPGEIRSY